MARPEFAGPARAPPPLARARTSPKKTWGRLNRRIVRAIGLRVSPGECTAGAGFRGGSGPPAGQIPRVRRFSDTVEGSAAGRRPAWARPLRWMQEADPSRPQARCRLCGGLRVHTRPDRIFLAPARDGIPPPGACPGAGCHARAGCRNGRERGAFHGRLRPGPRRAFPNRRYSDADTRRPAVPRPPDGEEGGWTAGPPPRETPSRCSADTSFG